MDTARWRLPIDPAHRDACVVTEGIDRSNQVNRQASLLDIVGGTGSIPIADYATRSWNTRESLRMVAGAFDHTPDEANSPAPLETDGFIPELANRLAQPAIPLRPLDPAEIALLLMVDDGGATSQVFRQLGGEHLILESAAATLLATRVAQRPGATPRTALLALEAIREVKVLEALAAGALDPDGPPLRITITWADLEGVA